MNIEEGVILRPNVKIGLRTTVKCGAILGTGITVGSDSYIGPGAMLLHMRPDRTSLPCVIGDNVFIGAGAIICPGVSVCNDVVIGAGSVVTKNITIGGTYAGNPCKRLR